MNLLRTLSTSREYTFLVFGDASPAGTHNCPNSCVDAPEPAEMGPSSALPPLLMALAAQMRGPMDWLEPQPFFYCKEDEIEIENEVSLELGISENWEHGRK
eukprot:scpid102463/ scgid7185/ 